MGARLELCVCKRGTLAAGTSRMVKGLYVVGYPARYSFRRSVVDDTYQSIRRCVGVRAWVVVCGGSTLRPTRHTVGALLGLGPPEWPARGDGDPGDVALSSLRPGIPLPSRQGARHKGAVEDGPRQQKPWRCF